MRKKPPTIGEREEEKKHSEIYFACVGSEIKFSCLRSRFSKLLRSHLKHLQNTDPTSMPDESVCVFLELPTGPWARDRNRPALGLSVALRVVQLIMEFRIPKILKNVVLNFQM